MSLLEHHSATHSVVGAGDLDVGRPTESARVRVLLSPAVDEEPPLGPSAGGATGTLDALLLAVASGDCEALAALEDRVGGLVRANIRRVLRDPLQSDAATRAFFAEVLRDASDFDPDQDSAQTWLLTHAHRRATRGLTSGQASDC